MSSSDEDNKNNGFGSSGYYNGFAADPEKQTSQDQYAGPRKMSRIDRPVTGSIAGMKEGRRGSASGEDVTVGQQMELEAGNAIKYRTCSWQKV